MNSFGRLLWVEMRRALHRRFVRWMIALALAFCALAGVIVYLSSRNPAKLTSDHPAHMVTWWSSGGGDGDSILLTAALFLVFGAAMCGASVGGAEWRAGTITTVLTWEPSRFRLHAARTASAAILAFLIGFALQVVFLASTLPGVLLNGSTEGTDGEWWIALVTAMSRISMITALIAVLAVSIATIGRNTSAALIGIGVWAFVAERTIAGLKPGWARYLIGENVVTVVPWQAIEDARFDLSPTTALATLLFYLAIIVVIATASFARRDVAAMS
ncbi:MAG TPA: hypothetical protein VMS14_03135 [Ilumatobacteraceae bacterium]|nr:hypothetical protein [Ilumatobacteraceae bacterium]